MSSVANARPNLSAAQNYTDSSDTVDGVMACTRKEFGFEVFNLGESQTVTLSQLIELLEKSIDS